MILGVFAACQPEGQTGDWTADGGLGDVPPDTGGGAAPPLLGALSAERTSFLGSDDITARVAFRSYADGGVPAEETLPTAENCEVRDDVAAEAGLTEEAAEVKVMGLATAQTTMSFETSEGAYVLPAGTYTWPSGDISFAATASTRVPALSAQVQAPAALSLTAPVFPAPDQNGDPVPLAVDRGQALAVAWSGAAASELWLSLQLPPTDCNATTGVCASPAKTLVCAPTDDGSFSIPAAKLGLLPAGREGLFTLERRRKAAPTVTGFERVSVTASTVTKGVITTSQ
jgi:hypothetical protein